ncbi:hypothetical protein ACFQV2_12145 [Actinokineospora soli]|uniref:Uncharacterized protein n=1 Tax=Actinokineospora soli TaxID=1048753 RepID=A0ABW2TLD9_9PSEU
MDDWPTQPIPRVRDTTPPATGHGHGHGHGHGPAAPASSRVRTFLAVLLAPFALAALIGFVVLFPTGDAPSVSSAGLTPVDGTVTAAQAGPCAAGDTGGSECLSLTVRLDDGPAAAARSAPPSPSSRPRRGSPSATTSCSPTAAVNRSAGSPTRSWTSSAGRRCWSWPPRSRSRWSRSAGGRGSRPWARSA